jgi:hypothetical protein
MVSLVKKENLVHQGKMDNQDHQVNEEIKGRLELQDQQVMMVRGDLRAHQEE